MKFLSDESLLMHKEYLRRLKLRYSILCKSFNGLQDLDIRGILRMKMPRDARDEAMGLYSEITLHKVFFSSFGSTVNPRCAPIETAYGSMASFAYEACKLALSHTHGFLALYNENGKLFMKADTDCRELLMIGTPRLALDLWEHSYFLDFGFDSERYVSTALGFFDFQRTII